MAHWKPQPVVFEFYSGRKWEDMCRSVGGRGEGLLVKEGRSKA